MDGHGGLTLLRDLAVIMMVAGLVTLLFNWLRQPVILGYLIAGLIVGPFTPPFSLVADEEVIRTLADLGIILLMYSLGLEFSLRKLRRVGAVALLGGALQVALVFAAVYQVGLWLGWGQRNAVFLAAALSISSTAIIVKVLEETGRTRRRSSQIMFGILVFEDFAAVAMLVALAGFATTGSADLAALGLVGLKLVLFGALSVVLGSEVVPRLMDYAARVGRREMLVVLGLGLCFGMALVSDALGLSVAAGAFIMGAIIAQARCHEAVTQHVAPVKDMFAALFFVAIGMLLNPAFVVQYWPHILLLTGALVVGKVIAGGVATFLMGYPLRVALPVGLGLAQIGEFSLVIVKVGQDTGAVTDFLYPVVVGVAAMSALVSPYLIRNSDALTERAQRALPQPWLRSLGPLAALLERFRTRASQPGLAGQMVRRAVAGIAINLLILTTVQLLARFTYERRAFFSEVTGLPAVLISALVLLTAVLFSLPSILALARYVRALVRGALLAVLRRTPGMDLPMQGVVQRALRDALLIPVVLLIGVLFHLGLPPVPALPQLPLLALAAAGIITAYLFWDSVRLCHQRLESLFWTRLLGSPEEGDEDEAEGLPPAASAAPSSDD